MNHSFGFDNYVSTISSQISANFQKIDRAFETCNKEQPQATLKYKAIYKSDSFID
jgi:hypothetical protein